jgi:hypothetical protein
MAELTTVAAIFDEGKVENIPEPAKKPVCETCNRPFSRP